MDFKIVDNQTEWDEFVAEQDNAPFLQSYSWGEFQKQVGKRVWRIGMFENEVQIGVAQVIEHYLGLGWGYLYCPKGPVFKNGVENLEFRIKEWVEFVKKNIANYGDIFVKIEPLSGEFTFIRTNSVQPANLWLTDLQKTEDEILQAMHQKTRYNVRLAEKKELEFRIMNSEKKNSEKEFEDLWWLICETSKRDKIKSHPKKYYQKMLEIVGSCVGVVYFENKPLAAGIFLGFNNTFTYLHGASSNENRDLMAPYFLHWQIIKYAKAKGFNHYDWGGINPDDEKDFNYKKSWEGITRFKKGFGGSLLKTPGTFDVILNHKAYKVFKFIKKLRKLI